MKTRQKTMNKMKRMDINEDKLRQIISESIKKVLNEELDEGIDFDVATRTVSYNPSHQNNVDTSIENNPTVDGNIYPNVQVWSIFKRRKGMPGDGNPLIYALKGEGWRFKTEQDKTAIENQFNMIATKFASMYPIGVTILMPSSNALNKHIADAVMSKSKNAKLIEGVIRKMTTEEINDIVMEPGSKFREYYQDAFTVAYYQLCDYLERMNIKKKGIFTRHMIADQDMRNVVDCTLKVSTDSYARFANKINGQDILIIDDCISRGQTIQEACRIMQETYSPKSITVLTLLSKL